MKVIETTYKGYKFRSRLEARWAVFFDAMGLEWEYEPEGYDLGSAGWYLPDFRISKLFDDVKRSMWVEIKGEEPTGKEIEKMRDLVKITNTDGWDYADGIIVWGDPYEYGFYSFCAMIPTITRCPKEHKKSKDADDFIHTACIFSYDVFGEQGSDFHRAMNAAITARQARFEHGQTPK